MKFYKINDESLDLQQKSKGLVADVPSANGEFVSNGKEYFEKIGNGEILNSTPVFDFFHLQSFGPKEEWEWRLQDVHGGMGVYPGGGCWYISDDFKLLLENFKIAKLCQFYETKLLYKTNKLKYWIFQFAGRYGKLNKMDYINFSKSTFLADGKVIEIYSYEEYLEKNEEFYDKEKKDLEIKRVVLNENIDFTTLYTICEDKIVSEKLKEAIEKMQLKGFIFSELDYEVVVNDEI
ncbi:hypothetical protein [Flavobacterium sp.]|uniref:hypothetical protein n=1 Tax=Flavobacterium sp. TaxID=239 RepID=UPI00286D4D13|nr:hypothetical protein [Flavobacterium sp.]